MINIFVTSPNDEEQKYILAALRDQSDFAIAGVAKDEIDTIIYSQRLKPDVLILDIYLSKISGPQIAPIIHRRSPSTAIIMLCDKDEDSYAGLSLKAGISGFLLKKTDMDILAPVVRIVYCGGCYISASITMRVFNAVTFMSQFQRYEEGVENNWIFSPTERGIIADIARGFSDAEIARHLHYSTGTIKNCVMAIKRKTKLKNRIQIAINSLIYGLINFEQLGFTKNNRQKTNDRIQ